MVLSLVLALMVARIYLKLADIDNKRLGLLSLVQHLQDRLENRSTGRRDRTGLEIRANDYICFSFTRDGKESIARVEWNAKDCAFKAIVVRGGIDTDAGQVLSFSELPYRLEVIGNTQYNHDLEE